MITLTRRQARALRGIFRRSMLGIAHRGPIPPLVLAAEGGQLCVRHRYAHLALEHTVASAWPSAGLVALPMDALADLEGRDEATVALEALTPERTVARWTDRGIPQAREHPVTPIEGLETFPGPPRSWSEAPLGLLDALAEATATAAEDDSRYALSCLSLEGSTGSIAATDGRQVLVQRDFTFPWAGDVLIRRSPLFACRDLPRDLPVSIGKTEAHVALKVGPWTIWLEVMTNLRFPPAGRRRRAGPPPGPGRCGREPSTLGHPRSRRPLGQRQTRRRVETHPTRVGKPATPSHVRAILSIARRQHADLDGLLCDLGDTRPEELSLAEASKLIDQLKVAAGA